MPALAEAPVSLSRFETRLATRADEPELRALMRRLVIPGDISIAFEREPDFFAACRIHGDVQVALARDRQRGGIVGFGTRSIAPAFVNGVPREVGYLADLRLDPAYRNGTLVARGYRLLRQMHADRRVELYTTVIFATNRVALATIATGRAGLPRYHDMGVVHCPGINSHGLWRSSRRRPGKNDGCDCAEIRGGTREMLDEMVDCLNRNNSRRQFAPVHSVRDFEPGGRWTDLTPGDFHVAFRDRRIVGVAAVWDQRRFKQTRIIGYEPHLGAALPLVNAWRRLTGGARYARAGEYLRYACLAFIAVDDDDEDVFRGLLRSAYQSQRGSDRLYLMVALHERDPWLRVVREYSITPFQARLFCVTFADGDEAAALDARIPHVEAALL
jgi:hypothetical protein